MCSRVLLPDTISKSDRLHGWLILLTKEYGSDFMPCRLLLCIWCLCTDAVPYGYFLWYSKYIDSVGVPTWVLLCDAINSANMPCW